MKNQKKATLIPPPSPSSPFSLPIQPDEGKGPKLEPMDVKKPKKAALSSAPRGRPASMNPGFWDAVEAERSGLHEVGIKAALAAAAAEAGAGGAVGGTSALPRHRRGEVVMLVELQAGASASVMARFWGHVLKVQGVCARFVDQPVYFANGRACNFLNVLLCALVGLHRCVGCSTVLAVRTDVHSILPL